MKTDQKQTILLITILENDELNLDCMLKKSLDGDCALKETTGQVQANVCRKQWSNTVVNCPKERVMNSTPLG